MVASIQYIIDNMVLNIVNSLKLGATASSAEAQAANTGQASSSGWYPGKYVAAAFRKGVS